MFLLVVFYLAVWAALFALFARWNSSRQRRLVREQVENAWFPPHAAREEYYALRTRLDDASRPDHLKQLCAALMKRAIEDIHRLRSLREERASLQQLVRQGRIGEDLWARFLAAEKDHEEEIMFCMQEAEQVRPGWSQSILNEAAQFVNHQLRREMEEERRRHDEYMAARRQEAEARLQGGTSSSDDDQDKEDAASPMSLEDKMARAERLAEELIAQDEADAKRARDQEAAKQRAAQRKKSK